jgi:hypothetical protein
MVSWFSSICRLALRLDSGRHHSRGSLNTSTTEKVPPHLEYWMAEVAILIPTPSQIGVGDIPVQGCKGTFSI